MQRRQFLLNTTIACAGAGAMSYSHDAKAIVFLGYIFIKPTILLAGKLLGGKAAATAVTAGGAKVLLSAAALAAVGAGAVLWVRSREANEATLVIRNNGTGPVRAPVFIGVENTDTGKLEMESHIGDFLADPGLEIKAPILFRDLKSTGNKRIIGWSTDRSIHVVKSDPIHVMDT